MRPVNLLPEQHRPRRASGERSGSAYVIVGVLGALVIAALVYVLSANQVSSRGEELAAVKTELADVQRQKASLAAFQDFAEIKQTRITSVAQLASQRIDWERTLRELSRLLPPNSWISNLDAARSGAGEAAPAATAPGGPTIKLTGCAPKPRDVATILVRLERLHGAKDVTLASSTRTSGGKSGGSDGEGDQGCGPFYSFDLTVALELLPAAPGTAAEKVPASLGGGS